DEERRPFVQRGMRLLEQQAHNEPLTANDYLIKAWFHRYLGEPDQALAAYRAGLLEQPQEAGIRLELAYLLFQEKRYREAQVEVRIVLEQHPRHAEGVQLKAAIDQQIARKGPG